MKYIKSMLEFSKEYMKNEDTGYTHPMAGDIKLDEVEEEKLDQTNLEPIDEEVKKEHPDAKNEC